MKGFRRLGIFLLCVSLVSWLYAGPVTAEEAKIKDLYVEIILDASNSMNELLDGRKKIDIAKEALNDVLDDISPDTYLALRIYGSDITKLTQTSGQSKEDAVKVACSDSVLKVGFGKGNISQIKSIINNSEAVGYTPIAYSLELAGNDFPVAEGNNFIILASDGQETCGGDPVAVINALKAKGINVIVHAIGFAVDEQAKLQLENIAKAGGGNYYSADTATQLKDSFKEVIRKIREIRGEEKEFMKGGEVIPGASYEDAPVVGPGEYRASNLALGENIRHVVRLAPIKRGQFLKIAATYVPIAGPKTVTFISVMTCNFYMFNKENKKVIEDSSYGIKISETASFSYTYSSVEDDEFYLVFNGLRTQSIQESAIGFSVGFTINIEDRFDAGSGIDASGELKNAYEIKSGTYEKNWIYPEGDTDKYTLKLEPGQTISVKIFPSDEWGSRLVIYNEDREEVLNVLSKNPGAVAKGSYTGDSGGKVYLGVEHSSGSETGMYEMEIEVTSGELKSETKK